MASTNCHGIHRDTQLLLFFGGMKAARNVKQGDILIGDDNTPRIVMQVSNIEDNTYKIIPSVGETFIINSYCPLSLYNGFTGQIVDIQLEDYILKSDNWKTKYKLFSKPVEYQHQPIKNDPYLVGLLLGSKKVNIDDIIKDYLNKKLDDITHNIQSGKKAVTLNTIDKEEIAYILNYRHIPNEYLYNTREVRHQLLRGFCDTYTVQLSRSPRSPRSPRSLNQSPSATSRRLKHSLTPKAVKRTTRAATPSKAVKRAPRSNRSGIEEFASAIQPDKKSALSSTPSLKRDKPKTLKIQDKILYEQMKFIIRSIGFECFQITDNLIIKNSIEVLPDINEIIQTDFSVCQYDRHPCTRIKTDKNNRFLLASCMTSVI